MHWRASRQCDLSLTRFLFGMRSHFLNIGLLVAITLFVFWQVRDFGFVNFDDPVLASQNPMILGGLTWGSVQTVFTEGHASMWLPLTSMSLMLDAEFYGRNASGYHTTNLLLHTANVLLLYAAMWSMTGAVRRSGFVAALFAVHPLHVESVAWISERKDVLSLFFGLLTILAYSRYVRAPGWKWYLLVLAAFSLGLMAKPMLVTLPCLLLLLDVWPLGRTPLFQPDEKTARVANERSKADITNRKSSGQQAQIVPFPNPSGTWGRLIVEKLPLLALSIVCSVLTYVAEHRGGALPSAESYPFDVRLANAVVVYVLYIAKTIWPTNLSVFYPHPGDSLSTAAVVGAAAALVVVSGIILASSRRRPYLAIGWLWYLGTLVPMIGLVQVGDYNMADRFTYFPIVGLFVLVAWLLPSLIPDSRWAKSMLSVAAVVIVIALALTARRQTAVWRDSVTLFEHSIASTRPNAPLQNNLALAYEERGEFSRAFEHYYAALAIDEHYSPARVNLGALLHIQGRYVDAIDQFDRALRVDAGNADAHHNRGSSLFSLGRLDEAVDSYRRAVKLNPTDVGLRIDLGVALYRLQRFDKAAAQFGEARKIDSQNAEARKWLIRTQERLKTPARPHGQHSPSS